MIHIQLYIMLMEANAMDSTPTVRVRLSVITFERMNRPRMLLQIMMNGKTRNQGGHRAHENINAEAALSLVHSTMMGESKFWNED
jgi:hypothetical protein